MLDTALEAGVSPETLRKIETGRVATPSFPTVAALADVLELSLDEVWVDICQPDRAQRSASAPSRTPASSRARTTSRSRSSAAAS